MHALYIFSVADAALFEDGGHYKNVYDKVICLYNEPAP